MRGLNLKSFKKVSGDDSHSVMQHEDGHQIKILHKPLSTGMKKQLMNLPVAKMAEGGKAENSPIRNFAQKYFGDEPAKGDEITPTGSPIDLVAGGLGAGLGNAALGDAGSVLTNEVGAVGPYLERSGLLPTSTAYMPNLTQQAVTEAIPVGEGMAAKAVGTAAQQAAETQAKSRAADFAARLAKQKATSKFADGGEVEEDAAPTNFIDQTIEPTNGPQISTLPRNSQPGAVPIEEASDPVAESVTPPEQSGLAATASAPPAETTPVTKPTAAPIDSYAGAQNAYISNLQQGAKEEIGGKYAEAAAIGAQGQAEAKALQASQDMLQHVQNTGQQKMEQVRGEMNAVVEDIKNSHIDPNHYLGSQDTIPRIATGIGLLLSGLGSGLTGKPNMAMEFLDKSIQRDIDAQRANLGKKENLVSAYQRQYGDIKDATQMAMATQGKLLEDQLLQAASTAKDPIAKARALQAAGEVHQKYANIPMQVAKNQALIQLTSGAAGSPQRGAQLLNVLRVSDPEAAKEIQKHAIPDGKGGVEFAMSVPEVTPADRDKFAAHNLLDANAKDLMAALRNKSSWSIKDRAVAEQKALALQSNVREGQLNTVYKAGEQPLLDKAVSEDPLSFKSRLLNTEPAKIQELIEANQRALRVHRQKLGLPTAAPIQFTPK